MTKTAKITKIQLLESSLDRHWAFFWSGLWSVEQANSLKAIIEQIEQQIAEEQAISLERRGFFDTAQILRRS